MASKLRSSRRLLDPRLEVDGTLEVLKAQEFFLLLSSTGLAFRRCELIRVEGSTVGVRFTESKKKGRPIIPP